MQDENDNGEGSSGQTAQFQTRGEPDHLRVEAGEGKKVRVEVDGKVVRGKLAVVTIVDDEGPQLVGWDKLEAGCLYARGFGASRTIAPARPPRRGPPPASVRRSKPTERRE